MNKKKAERNMEKRLRDLDADIDRTKAKATVADTDFREGYQRDIGRLKHRRQAMKERLRELRSSGTEAWQDIRLGTGQAFNDLSRAVKSTWARFR